jgi:hypothetical protein
VATGDGHPIMKEGTTMSKTITMSIDISDQFLADVLTTAVEQGIGDWAVCSEINRCVDGDGYDQYTIVSAVIHDREFIDSDGDDEPEFPMTKITTDTVALGMQRLMSGDIFVADDIASQISTSVREADCDIDSLAADCIIQAGMLNKIVFG